ncbi:MAG: DNA-binding response regulator [Gammaproteobacteria bacterium]|nr:MAG: DNA-binding response regulator [Gammaproteobacteria bacterium]
MNNSAEFSKVIKQEKIRLVYADDEKPARDKLAHQLSLMNNIEVIGVATTGKEAITIINELCPDVVLLDIQMPEVNGLELVDLLNYQPIIIYTTAYDEFAIHAFEKASTDYLLKPFPLARLKSALDKAANKLWQQRIVNNSQYREQEHNKQQAQENGYQLNAQNKINKLISKNGERIHLLSPDELKFIKSEQGNSMAFNGESYFYLSDTLDQLEQKLTPQKFIRIHRSYLVNLDHIKEIQRWFNGKLMIIINDKNKTELSTSRAGADKLKKILGI